MIELSLPELGKESKSAKDLVINVLLEESPLSLMQLYNNIKKNYNISITYQAVRKAGELLLKKEILKKNNRSYSLNKSWFIKLKSFVDKVLISNVNTNLKQFKTAFSEKNYCVFTLNSLFELDNFWGDVLKYLVNNIKSEKKLSINIGVYAWWMIINLGRESDLFHYFAKQNIKTYFIFFNQNLINQYAKQIYESLGHNVRLAKIKSNNCLAVNTIGDTIIQVEYPKKIMGQIKKYFENYSIENPNLPLITKIIHSKCEIQFAIFKNKEFAENFNEKYLKYFKNNKK